MKKNEALISRYVLDHGNSLLTNVTVVGCAVVILSLMAQVSIPLPFTPVPITGQTFAVSFLALMLGRKLGTSSVFAYLLVGAAGLPVFAAGKSSLGGPTTGYLVGMLLGTWIMGTLSDRGCTKSFIKTFLVSYIGSVCVFGYGLLILSLFIPHEGLFVAGLYPFLFGDFLKNILATTLVTKTNNFFGGQS
ncbi:biotin transporter BioY [Bdellovibrio sp. qaytius]|nr:biotin transporter BioY [Bdellovibrio sp. qaytius]